MVSMVMVRQLSRSRHNGVRSARDGAVINPRFGKER